MALADVQMIVQSLENAKQQQLQKAQLAQQQQQFQQDLAQRVQEHKASLDMQKSQLNLAQLQLQGQLAQHPEALPYMGGKVVGAEGLNQGYGNILPNQNLTYEFGGVKDSEGTPLTITAPSPDTYAAQQAQRERVALAPKVEAEKNILSYQGDIAANAAALKARNDFVLKQLEFDKEFERQKAELQNRRDLSDDEIKSREKIAGMERSSQYSIAKLNRDSAEKIAGMNLGMIGDPNQEGSIANQIHNKAVGVYLGDQSSKSAKGDLGLKGQVVNMDNHLLSLGGTSLSDAQINNLNTLPIIKDIVGKIDAFQKIDGKLHPLELRQAQAQIKSLLPNLINTVDSSSGKTRIMNSLIDAANAAYNVSLAPNMLNTNDQIRDNIVRTFRSFAKEQTNNLSPKQQKDVLYHKGYNDLRTLDEEKALGLDKDKTQSGVNDYFNRHPLQ